MNYDPTRWGARCTECPLASGHPELKRPGGPVPPELPRNAMAAVVGRSPELHEVKHGRPMVGPLGREITEAVYTAGYQRDQVSWHNLIACQLPRGKRGDVDLQVYARKAKKLGYASPVACCLPRLQAELEGQLHVIGLGAEVAKTLHHTIKGINDMRGSPLVTPPESPLGEGVKVVYTYLSTQKTPNLRWVQWSDIARAQRHFTNTLRWAPYEFAYVPSVEEIDEFLADPHQPFWAHDLETTRVMTARNIRPLEVTIRCLSIAKGDGSAVIVIPFLSVDNVSRYYSDRDMYRIKQRLHAAFTDGRVWCGHNSLWFDRIVLERHGFPVPRPQFDTMGLHRQAHPYMHHRLGVVGTTELDVQNWKTDDDGEDTSLQEVDAELAGMMDSDDDAERAVAQAHVWRTDEELWDRNALDSIVTARIVGPVWEKVQDRYPDGGVMPGAPHMTIQDMDLHASEFCANLTKQGVFVNQEHRGRAEAWLTAMANDLRLDIAKRVHAMHPHVQWNKKGTPFSPSSPANMVQLLYGEWDLEPREFTPGGVESASDKAVRLHIMEDPLTPDQEGLLLAIRRWKRIVLKWLGTVVRPLAVNPLDFKGNPLRGYLSPDGRARSAWKAFGTGLLRYSADGPAMQIIPSAVKPIFTAEPGRLLFGADADQIHPRIFSYLWQVERLQEAFHNEWDPYGVVAEVMFSTAFTGAAGYRGKLKAKEGQAAKLRKIAKEILLACAYGASEKTGYQQVAKAEDDFGNLAMKGKLDFKKFCALRRKLLQGFPEIEAGWHATASEAEANGWADPSGVPYLRDPIAGWRLDFPGGVYNEHGGVESDVINAKILTAEAALMHLREIELLKAIPFEKWGPGTGVILQCHDSITGEAPASEAKKAAETVAECLTYTCAALGGMRFTAEAVHGFTLLEA